MSCATPDSKPPSSLQSPSVFSVSFEETCREKESERDTPFLHRFRFVLSSCSFESEMISFQLLPSFTPQRENIFFVLLLISTCGFMIRTMSLFTAAGMCCRNPNVSSFFFPLLLHVCPQALAPCCIFYALCDVEPPLRKQETMCHDNPLLFPKNIPYLYCIYIMASLRMLLGLSRFGQVQH